MINLAVIAGITLVSHLIAVAISFVGLKVFFDFFLRIRERRSP